MANNHPSLDSGMGYDLVIILQESPSATSVTSESTIFTTKRLLSNALNAHPISALHLLGPSTQGLQVLKTEAYTLAGKLGRNLSVTLHEVASTKKSELAAKLSAITSSGSPHGVLLISDDAESNTNDKPASFLEMNDVSLYQTIDESIGMLHAVARSTISSITRSAASSRQAGAASNQPFFAISTSPNSQHSKLSSELQSLALSEIQNAVPHVAIGFADNILQALVEKVDEKISSRLGSMNIDIPQGTNGVMQEDLEGSPTKLWAEWALQEELGNMQVHKVKKSHRKARYYGDGLSGNVEEEDEDIWY
ncbi:hypothetical protein C1H76_8186 [Elsinoe australis]|uniref:Uncharacterized protein n=1 Tax=Elsinoe australis TaxID=40998 RepID=A0A4U7AVC7_9PEZI|nr:hypothetical protein C1H76_8186 [Elsinoe australis]